VKAYEEALPFFPDDLFLKESLYLAYRLSGQKVKADIFAKTLPEPAGRDWASPLRLSISSAFPVGIRLAKMMRKRATALPTSTPSISIKI